MDVHDVRAELRRESPQCEKRREVELMAEGERLESDSGLERQRPELPSGAARDMNVVSTLREADSCLEHLVNRSGVEPVLLENL